MNTDKKLAEGHIFTTQPDGVMRQDYLFRVSIKAVIYNDEGQDGQVSDYQGALLLMDAIDALPEAKALLADRDYDAD